MDIILIPLYKLSDNQISLLLKLQLQYKLTKDYIKQHLQKKNREKENDISSNSSNNSNSVNENFSVNNSIQDFITDTVLVSDSLPPPNELHSLSSTQLQEYSNRLSELTRSINNASNTNAQPQQNVSVSPDTIQKLDLESQQQYQMFQLDYLNRQLQQARDNINANAVSSSSNNYKPIKIYSSCAISNANGSTTIDTPVKSPFACVVKSSQNQPNNYSSNNNSSNNNSSNNNSSNNTQQTTQMLQTISQSLPQQPTNSNPLNLNQNTGIFNPLLNALFKNNTNTNISV